MGLDGNWMRMDPTNTVNIKFQLMYFYDVECLFHFKWKPKNRFQTMLIFAVVKMYRIKTPPYHLEVEFCLLLQP